LRFLSYLGLCFIHRITMAVRGYNRCFYLALDSPCKHQISELIDLLLYGTSAQKGY